MDVHTVPALAAYEIRMTPDRDYACRLIVPKREAAAFQGITGANTPGRCMMYGREWRACSGGKTPEQRKRT